MWTAEDMYPNVLQESIASQGRYHYLAEFLARGVNVLSVDADVSLVRSPYAALGGVKLGTAGIVLEVRNRESFRV